MSSKILIDDFNRISELNFISWNMYKNTTFLVTGATGLIGSYFVKALVYISDKYSLNITIKCIVRNLTKAKATFTDEYKRIEFIEANIEKRFTVGGQVDYILHAANPTDSKFFVKCPVETIKSTVLGTSNILEVAHQKKIKAFIYLSSMEVYGHPDKGHWVSEAEVGGFDTENTRNSYPISKQLCESLCCSYFVEYGVPVRVLRLTQTFGPGVTYEDGRIFAEFMRCVIEKKNIILKTKGETERCYLYIADAVSAILNAMEMGRDGQCYSVANPDTYCSIRDMAEMVAKDISSNRISVEIHLEDVKKAGFAETLYMKLDVSKIVSLGWKPYVNLKDMYKYMINYWVEQNNG